jgi:hypothetical protein
MNDHQPPFRPHVDLDDNFDLGTSFNPNPKLPQSQEINLNTAFVQVAETCKGDAAMLQRLISLIGPDIIAAAKARKVPVRMPTTGIRAIECSIAYSPPRARGQSKSGKPTRVREDRAKLDYYVKIQLFDSKSQGLADPVWSGAAQLRSPDRAAKDARSKKLKTSLSDKYADWIDSEVIPAAKEADLLIGFLMDKRAGEGTYFHEFQVILVERQGLENKNLNFAIIVSCDEKDGKNKTKYFHLPKFSEKTSSGKALSGTFILQSRGITKSGDRKEWATGVIVAK